MLLMAIVVRRSQNLIASAGLVGEHLGSSLMVMDRIGVQSQVCIRPFVAAALEAL
jgi:hypothetical protein